MKMAKRIADQRKTLAYPTDSDFDGWNSDVTNGGKEDTIDIQGA